MEDGIITDDEESELEQLRERLNLDEIDAEQLFRAYSREVAKNSGQRPHCGKPILASTGSLAGGAAS